MFLMSNSGILTGASWKLQVSPVTYNPILYNHKTTNRERWQTWTRTRTLEFDGGKPYPWKSQVLI